MAEGTVINAQVNLGDTECDLCSTYKNVKWKCVNCNETLCEQCKTAHQRSKVSRHHIILDLKVASHQSPGSSVFCQRHPIKVLNLYCTTCDYLVCLDCIRGDHCHHQFDNITDVTEEKQKEFNNIIIYVKQNTIPTLTKVLQIVMEDQSMYDQETDHVISDITSTAQELKAEIDEIRGKLIRDLEKRRKEDQKYLKEKQMNIKEKLNEMKKLVRESEETMKNLSDLRIFQKLNDIKQALSSLESISEVPKIIPPAFVPGSFEQKQLEKMYGNIVDKSEENSEKQPDINVSIISSFTFISDVWAMQTISPNEVFIGVNGEKEICLLNRKGQLVKTLRNNSAIYRRIAVTTSGDILATTQHGNLIHRVTQSGVVNVFSDMIPYKTYGIYVTNDGDVLVGLNKDGRGRLVRLSPTGQIKNLIEYDDNKSLLYVYPSYITQNINGDTWVSDTYSDDPRVTVVDVNGGYRFTYRGPTNLKMDQKFSPLGIVHNQYGHILVADYDNDTIHLVNKDGGFLQYVLTKREGITKPRALSVDDDAQLWVGGWNGKVFVVKYLS